MVFYFPVSTMIEILCDILFYILFLIQLFYFYIIFPILSKEEQNKKLETILILSHANIILIV